MDIQRLFEDARQEAETLSWEGTFEQYLNMVIENSAPARQAHARIYDMIMANGVTPGLQGVPTYGLFAREVFGLDKTLDRIVQYFHAAARGTEVKKRILLLMGPPASGKSTIVNLIKRGLEAYSRRGEGALYAIQGCPMQEEPLHLVPPRWREELAREYGIHIEGDLCPRCRYALRQDYGGDISRVKVRRVTISEGEGVGMGSFVATSPFSSDVARLVGSMDTRLLSGDRVEAAGRAFHLEGEFQAANRGMMEFIQIFKSDERFLTVLLGVTQEQMIKLGGFGSVFADEAIVAHTNEEEYNAFVANKQTEALLDRLIQVRVPYNLSVSEEVKIYRKMLAQSELMGAHLAPLTLWTAATLAVLSRLELPRGVAGFPARISLTTKLKLYDGQVVPPYTSVDVESLHEDSPREGMFGISPRYVMNRLADAVARSGQCLLPTEALQSLVEGVEERAGLSPEEQDRIPGLLRDATQLYQEMAVREVQRTATEDFEERSTHLFLDYVRGLEASFSEAEGGALVSTAGDFFDERLMRRLEGALGVRDMERSQFREGLFRTYSILKAQNRSLSYDSLLPLKLAIENQLFPQRNEVAALLSSSPYDVEKVHQRHTLVQRLLSKYGYCEKCAEDLLNFVAKVLQGRRVLAITRRRPRWL